MIRQRRSKKVHFAFFKAINYSGQSAASQLIIEGLAERGWRCSIIPIYPLERGTGSPVTAFLKSFFGQVRTMFSFFGLLLEKTPILHLNLGQGFGSFSRIFIPFFAVRLLKRKMKVVISLHGSVFMTWERRVPEIRVFLWFLRSAELITVLGERQGQRLVELGIDKSRVKVLPNTTSIDVVSEEFVKEKQKAVGEVVLLHLSLLIESKGFPLFLEAVERLARANLATKVRAILCGPLATTIYCTDLCKDDVKEKWILEKINRINEVGGGKVSAQWIRGASGSEKTKLFRDADIFVFPSQFPVEAQPLVLLEAMASGCSLVTTDVGEIPSTLKNIDACVLNEVTVEDLVENLTILIGDAGKRSRMALSGVAAMKTSYSIERHIDQWEQVFLGLCNQREMR